MKHQYFGDVNDYVKYGLLRCFAGAGFHLGICWMLTPEDLRSDGRKTGYLSRPEAWGHYDPDLFELLLREVPSAHGRHFHHIEARGIIPNALFFGDIVPDIKIDRSTWYRNALAKLNGAKLLFFDPDNGIEVSSKPMGRKGSSKYVYWEELRAAWERNMSLLVFQHFPRVKRNEYIPAMVAEMRARIKGACVVPLKATNVLFLLAHRASDRPRVSRVIRLTEEKWSPHVVVY